MAPYTSGGLSNSLQHTLFSPYSSRFGQRSRLLLPTSNVPFTNSGLRQNTTGLVGVRSSKETSKTSQLIDQEQNGVETMKDDAPLKKDIHNETLQRGLSNEESPLDEQTGGLEFFNKLNLKVDGESAYPFLIYGGGAVVALWFTSAIVTAIDSIPVFPKLMEIVGLAYSIWFGARYLLFKRSRDELGVKVEELKQQVLGEDD